MTPFSPEDLNELAAGYVLGDLTSEESALFQQCLQQDSALQLRVTQLEKTLGTMALGMPAQAAPQGLRSRIMQTADEAKVPPGTSFNVPHCLSPDSQGHLYHQRGFSFAAFWSGRALLRKRLLLWGGGAALIAIAFGVQRHHLQQQIAMLQTALSQKQGSPALSVVQQPLPVEATLIVEAPADVLAEQWPGLRHLRDDYRRSRSEMTGPEENRLQDGRIMPIRLREHLKPSPTMPRLVEPIEDVEAQFLAVTPCEMGETEGLRMTYLLDQKTPVSVYKLKQGGEFPHPGTEAMSLQSAEGLSMILWEDGAFLYALVSDLPVNRLKKLSIIS